METGIGFFNSHSGQINTLNPCESHPSTDDSCTLQTACLFKVLNMNTFACNLTWLGLDLSFSDTVYITRINRLLIGAHLNSWHNGMNYPLVQRLSSS